MAKDKINLLDPEDLEKLEKPARKPKEFIITQLGLKYDKSLKSDYVVDSVEKAIYLINDYLADSPNECLMGISLNKDKEPVCACVLGMGDDSHVDINIKNTFKFVFASGGDSFILAHNHPNAKVLKPSDGDISAMNEIMNIATKLGVRIRDFIITGNVNQNRAYYSFAEKGVITQYDFLQRLKKVDTQQPIDIGENSERTIDEVNELLAESEYNSEESLKSSTKEKSSKSIFSMFK